MMHIDVFSTGPVETNAILISCSKTRQAALIDAPFGSAAWYASKVGPQALSVQMVLFTHSHWDHIAEAALLKKQFNAPLFIHEEDAKNLESPGSDGLPLYLPVEGVKADQYLHHGQILHLGELSIEVIHTPGHTPGCVCFYEEANGVLITGDTLFQGTIGNLSFPTARPAMMEQSLKKLSLLPPKTRVYPGHGEATTIGDENWIHNWRLYG